jgi:heterodisulfide reductase subunit C1
LGANYQGEGPGILKKTPQGTLDELKSIFEVTGGKQRFEKIEEFSKKKAEELGMGFDETITCEYFGHIYKHNNNKHIQE